MQMMKMIFLVLTLALCFYAQTSYADNSNAFENFIQQFGNNSCSGQTEQVCKQNVEAASKSINSNNQLFNNSGISYTQAMNKYSSLLYQTFLTKMTGYISGDQSNAISEESFSSVPDDAVPDCVDWRDEDYVTGVKDQDECAACWAFSATGSLEGQWKNKTGKLVSLSEQNLIDCSTPQGNQGCNGGWMSWAFDYIKKNCGIEREWTYPYENKDDICRYLFPLVAADIRGYATVQSLNERALKIAIALVGPISVAFYVVPSFQNYASGVYQDPTCSTGKLNHALLLVGYCTTPSGVDYYIAKNSWGTTWGENGYALIARNAGNMCGIATAPVYPIC